MYNHLKMCEWSFSVLQWLLFNKNSFSENTKHTDYVLVSEDDKFVCHGCKYNVQFDLIYYYCFDFMKVNSSKIAVWHFNIRFCFNTNWNYVYSKKRQHISRCKQREDIKLYIF